MNSTDDTNAADRGSGCNDLLGLALEGAAYDCLSALTGVETHDVNLRDHPEAWAALETFATKVRAAERERWRAALWDAAQREIETRGNAEIADALRDAGDLIGWPNGQVQGLGAAQP